MRHVLIPRSLPAAIPLPWSAQTIQVLRGETMGTTWSVKFVRPSVSDQALDHRVVMDVLDRVVRQMSTWLADSDIGVFNRAAPGTWQTLPQELALVLRHALTIARDTDGAYDPTIGELVDVWGFGPAGRRTDVPTDAQILAVGERAGWRRLRSTGDRFLQPGGLSLDLSSIAKGFAVDALSQQLSFRGVSNHLVEIGGELRGTGVKPDGSPWWVALEQVAPDSEIETSNAPAEYANTIVALTDLAVATSGDSHRWFESNGRRYAHTLDPRTGYPTTHELVSVSVLHASCMTADALATALTVLGPEDGFHFATERNIAARFVSRAGGVVRSVLSPALEAMLE